MKIKIMKCWLYDSLKVCIKNTIRKHQKYIQGKFIKRKRIKASLQIWKIGRWIIWQHGEKVILR